MPTPLKVVKMHSLGEPVEFVSSTGATVRISDYPKANDVIQTDALPEDDWMSTVLTARKSKQDDVSPADEDALRTIYRSAPDGSTLRSQLGAFWVVREWNLADAVGAIPEDDVFTDTHLFQLRDVASDDVFASPEVSALVTSEQSGALSRLFRDQFEDVERELNFDASEVMEDVARSSAEKLTKLDTNVPAAQALATIGNASTAYMSALSVNPAVEADVTRFDYEAHLNAMREALEDGRSFIDATRQNIKERCRSFVQEYESRDEAFSNVGSHTEHAWAIPLGRRFQHLLVDDAVETFAILHGYDRFWMDDLEAHQQNAQEALTRAVEMGQEEFTADVMQTAPSSAFPSNEASETPVIPPVDEDEDKDRNADAPDDRELKVDDESAPSSEYSTSGSADPDGGARPVPGDASEGMFTLGEVEPWQDLEEPHGPKAGTALLGPKGPLAEIEGLTTPKPLDFQGQEYIPREDVIAYTKGFAKEFEKPIGLHRFMEYPSEADMRYLAFFKLTDSEEDHKRRRKLYYEGLEAQIASNLRRADAYDQWFRDHGLKTPKPKQNQMDDPYHGIGLTFLLRPGDMDPALASGIAKLSRKKAVTHQGSRLDARDNGKIHAHLPLKHAGNAADPNELRLLAKMTVLEAQSRGWDHIKVRSWNPEFRQAILDEAKQAGMMVTSIGMFGWSRTYAPVDGVLPPMKAEDNLDPTREPKEKRTFDNIPPWKDADLSKLDQRQQNLPDPTEPAPSDPGKGQLPDPSPLSDVPTKFDKEADDIGSQYANGHVACIQELYGEYTYPNPDAGNPDCPWKDPLYEGHVEGAKAFQQLVDEGRVSAYGVQMVHDAESRADRFTRETPEATYSSKERAQFMSSMFYSPIRAEANAQKNEAPAPA